MPALFYSDGTVQLSTNFLTFLIISPGASEQAKVDAAQLWPCYEDGVYQLQALLYIPDPIHVIRANPDTSLKGQIEALRILEQIKDEFCTFTGIDETLHVN